MVRLGMVFLVLSIFFGLTVVPASADTNVAFGKPVTLSGSFGGGGGGSVVDGTFLPEGTQWQSGTVWWNGLSPAVYIDLGGACSINSLVVQADDNDAYTLYYRIVGTTTYGVAWNVPDRDAWGYGMQTRPNPYDNNERYNLVTPIVTDSLMFVAASGDNSYSVSEIQAYGSAVPIPGALLLFAPGLAGLAVLRRKFAK